MNITIIDEGGCVEPEAISKAVMRANRFDGDGKTATIFVRGRAGNGAGFHFPDPPGWLEYLIVIQHADGRPYMTIGMIQRSVGAEFEFHS